MRRPPLKSLAMFDCAARHLNFRVAAEELHLTQGAVAQQVRKLEAELRVKLFVRRARGLELTEHGAQYHKAIRKALLLIDKASEQLVPDKTTITISVTPSFAAKWLVKKLATFSKQNPGIKVSTRASEKLVEFETENVDLAIRQGQPPFGKGLAYELLTPENLIAVCHPDYARKIQPVNDVKEFLKLELIEDSHQQWKNILGKHACFENVNTQYLSQTSLAMEAAGSNQGVAIVPMLLAIDDISEGKLTCVWSFDKDDDGGYYFVFPEGETTKSHARTKIVNWLTSEMGA